MELKKKYNHSTLLFGGKSFFSVFLVLFPFLLLFYCFCPWIDAIALAADDKQKEDVLKKQEHLKQREAKLWQDANKGLQTGNDREAADYFLRYYKDYPDSPQAEEALWKAANLQLALAQGRPDADWEKVQELFRSFTLDYPQSPHLSDAYFEVANAYYQMRFYREALTYFGLYSNRFGSSSRVGDALYMKASILLKIGRLSEAGEVFRELGQIGGVVEKLRAQAGLAHIDFAKGKYHDALAVYLKILKKNPAFYVVDPELLHNEGLANLRVGNSQEGRKNLLQYLNIAGESAPRSDILYEIAESYLADGFKHMAGKIFEQVVETGEAESRPVVLSRLRLAEVATDSPVPQSLDGRKEIAQQEGDKPFQDVLDLHYEGTASQDARFELVRRYWQRKEYDQAYSMGKSYLRYETTPKEKKEVVDIMGRILAMRMDKLFQEKKFKEVYQIYKDEYPYVILYEQATLLFLTGRALEEMGLFRQASVIYYSAMSLGLSDEEQLDLYFHRARTYLAENDFQSAQRLLKYLRKIYAGDEAMGEVCSLSGQLREKQNRSRDALSFYQIAVEKPTFVEKKAQYATDYLRLLFELDEIRAKVDRLETFRRENWLPPEELQYWYGKLAERYRRDNNLENAGAAYLVALGEKMPRNNEAAQRINLSLGDVLFLQGKKNEAATYYRKVLEGPNGLVKKLAQQRLTQEDINKAMADTQAVMRK